MGPRAFELCRPELLSDARRRSHGASAEREQKLSDACEGEDRTDPRRSTRVSERGVHAAGQMTDDIWDGRMCVAS